MKVLLSACMQRSNFLAGVNVCVYSQTRGSYYNQAYLDCSFFEPLGL